MKKLAMLVLMAFGAFGALVVLLVVIGAIASAGKDPKSELGTKPVPPEVLAAATAAKPAKSSNARPPMSLVERAKEREREEAERQAETRCVLSLTTSRVDDVPVLPTEEGYTEFMRAKADGDGEAMVVALRANGGFMVDGSTRCAFLDVGILGPSKVRVLEGPNKGRAGYVPTEWTRGVK